MFHLRKDTAKPAKSAKLPHGSQPTLFDIRLKSTHKNILIIKGSEYEAPSVLVSGNVVFALPEKITVKRIGLKLIGTFKLDFMEVLTHHNRISSSNPVKESKVVLQCDWDNLLVSSEGQIRVGDYGDNLVSSSATTSSANSGSSTPTTPLARGIAGSGPLQLSSSSKSRIKRAGAPTLLQLPELSIHTTPFENIMTPSGSNTFVLPLGNYELPFKCVLPGNIPETIEGLQSGSVLYKFEACIEKSSSLLKASVFTRHKYVRIFRTLSSNNMLLSEEVSIANTWVGRVQYEVSIPKKAIAIGAASPVRVLIIPLKKKLRLGKISASIIQHYVLKDSNEELYDHDQIIFDCELPPISMDDLGQDRWDIQLSIPIPMDLKTVTQDCDLRDGLIKVKHKLKFKIQLVNEEDNHISELRAKLPVTLYVNPHYKVLARNIELDNSGKVHIRPGGITIFENGKSGSRTPGTRTPGSRTPGTRTPAASSPPGTGTNTPNVLSRPQSPSLDPIFDAGEMEEENSELEDNNAPPMYEQHIYDQLYDALTGATSPPTSPRPILARNTATSPSPSAEPGSYFDLTPGSSTPTHQLLRQYLSQQGSVRGCAGIGNPNVAEDEFVTNINSGAQTPALREHLSSLDLSRVPSYNELVEGNNDDDEANDLLPLYDDDDDDDVMRPPRPALQRSHSTGNAREQAAPKAASPRLQPSGSQSYFDVSRNNSSNDLLHLGMSRPASVGNFSDLLARRLAKKNHQASHPSNLHK